MGLFIQFALNELNIIYLYTYANNSDHQIFLKFYCLMWQAKKDHYILYLLHYYFVYLIHKKNEIRQYIEEFQDF